ncbi:Nitroreductase [Desulfonatronum thiosulfatophilum]|uniref:Nitroreductase n=1 Tax=Desulfonatronum thiosulfatophilum TaxID=617002 RepID=A0A1G6EV28_9BACT|nr:nitroreductase family protein [Desulfonatronum thiosulfatophilum]SDB61276.1 Nitroreductase [Desulfonatronum thiosulfatophilum]
MTVKEAIQARRSIRKFTDQPVIEEQMAILLEAVRLAPSSINCQPWRIKVLTQREDIQWLSGAPTKGQRWIAGAGAVMICCADVQRFVEDSATNVRFLRDSGMLPPEMLAGLEEYLSKAADAQPEVLRWAAAANCAIALSQVMLQAVELGLGTCWVGMYDEAAVKERFQIPEAFPVVAMLAIGHPAESQGQRPRKDLRDILL